VHGRFPRGKVRSATPMERSVVEAIPAARTSRCCYACGGKDLLDGFEMEPKDANGLGWYLCSLHARQGLCQPMRGHAAVCSTHVIVATLQPCKRLEHCLVHLGTPTSGCLVHTQLEEPQELWRSTLPSAGGADTRAVTSNGTPCFSLTGALRPQREARSVAVSILGRIGWLRNTFSVGNSRTPTRNVVQLTDEALPCTTAALRSRANNGCHVLCTAAWRRSVISARLLRIVSPGCACIKEQICTSVSRMACRVQFRYVRRLAVRQHPAIVGPHAPHTLCRTASSVRLSIIASEKSYGVLTGCGASSIH
jgi:hypothetical protein